MKTQDIAYCYDLQAWVIDGKIAECGHNPKSFLCTSCTEAGKEHSCPNDH